MTIQPVRGRYERSCGVRDCENRGRHEHAGPLVVGEEVVLVVNRPDAPRQCWANVRAVVERIETNGDLRVRLDFDISRYDSDQPVRPSEILLRPGDAVRARGWSPPARKNAQHLVRKEAVIDAVEPTLALGIPEDLARCDTCLTDTTRAEAFMSGWQELAAGEWLCPVCK